MAQPHQRKDLFGTEGIGEDDDPAIGTAGRSSQGGTASSHTGGTRGHAGKPGNPANRQGADNADAMTGRSEGSGKD